MGGIVIPDRQQRVGWRDPPRALFRGVRSSQLTHKLRRFGAGVVSNWNSRVSIKLHGEQDAGLADHKAPGFTGSDLELPILRRADRGFEGDLVLAR